MAITPNGNGVNIMSIELKTVRARTRGKSPVLFEYQGVGKLTARPVMDKDGNPIKGEDGKEILVDDVDASGLTENVQDVIDLYGAAGNANPMQAVIDGALDWFNHLQRKAAAPVTEQVTEDELTPIVAALTEAKLLTEENAGVWRRTVTMAAKQTEMERIDYVQLTKEVKALLRTDASKRELFQPATV